MKTIFRSIVILSSCFGMVGMLSAQWIYSLRPAENDFSCIAVSDSIVFVGSFEGGGVYRSLDNGVKWAAASSGLANDRVNALLVSGKKLFAGTRGAGVFVSSDKGKTWNPANTDMTDADVRSLAVSGSSLFAGTHGNGIFRSTNEGEGWTQVNSGLTDPHVLSLVVKGTDIFAGTDSTGVFLSTDNGESWVESSSGLRVLHGGGIDFCPEVAGLAVSGSAIFAGTDGGIFRTIDNGWTWQEATTGIPIWPARTKAVLATNMGILAALDGEGIYLSINKGGTWTDFNDGLVGWFWPHALAASGSFLYSAAGTVWRRSMRTPVFSEDWEFVMDADTANHGSVTFEKYLDGSIGATGSWSYSNEGSPIGGIFSSTSVEITNNSLSIEARGLAEYMGSQSVFDQTMIGNLESVRSSGTFEMSYFAGGWPVSTQGNYVATLIRGTGVTSVDEIMADSVPRAFSLSQNYPNPFNPFTTIFFSIPSKSFMSLKIYDLMGREVTALVNEELPAGNHTRRWNANYVSSGVYFYRLQAGNYLETKKMLLIR